MNISFCGAGQFGFALLKHLERKYEEDTTVSLLTFDVDQPLRDSLKNQHKHAYLDGPNSFISEKVIVCDTITELISQADILVLAVNSAAIKSVYDEIKRLNKQNLKIVNVAKALDDNGLPYSMTATAQLQGINYHYAALVGGSIATDLLEANPLGLTLATEDREIAIELAQVFENGALKVYPETDLIGVQLASALKNVISLMGGLVEGVGYSYGTMTYMIVSAAKEIADFAVKAYGAKPETYGMFTQHWGNDMWMSATGPTRNHKFGVLIGQGKTHEEAFSEMQTKTVESLYTLQGMCKSPAFNDLVIIKELYEIFIAKTKLHEQFKEFILAHKF